MEQTTTRPWLKWAWRHYCLEVDEFDSLEEAVSMAWWASEEGSEALACIEGPDGVVPRETVDEMFRQQDRRSYAEYEARPKHTHGVRLTAPDGKDWAWYDTLPSESEALASAAKLRSQFGDARVRVVRLHTT